MRRLLVLLIISLILLTGSASAQAPLSQPGDPPNTALITISAPDEEGFVTLTGTTGAVFPNAYVTIRNLYTQETAYLRTGVTGSFSTQMRGGGNTPFWISPAAQGVPENERGRLGSLPGGEGAILYSAFAQDAGEGETAQTVTPLAIDGDVSDWSRLSAVPLTGGVYALRNSDSLYVALTQKPAAYARVEVRFTVDAINYGVSFDPRTAQPAALQRLNPAVRDLGALPIAAWEGGVAVEARIPFSFSPRSDNVQLDSILFRDDAGAALVELPLSQPLARRDESDGIVRAVTNVPDETLRFYIAGAVGRGASVWTAQGRANALDLSPGAAFNLSLDVQVEVADIPADTTLIGVLALQPIAVDEGNGVRVVSDARTNNGWSSVRAASGLAIDNLTRTIPLGETSAQPHQIVRDDGRIAFPLDFSLTLPSDLAPGLYVPVFSGFTSNSGGARAAWIEGGVFGQGGDAYPDEVFTRLPLVMNAGGVQNARLLWTLFMDDPSDGSRGVLADEDRAYAALSNRTRYNSRTYILPPGTYSLEPSLLNQMSNLYTYTGEPLIPFAYPSGSLSVQVMQPNRDVVDLGTFPIEQSRVSSSAFDERTRFGAQTPVDIYGLTTRQPALTDYAFDQYGDYQITMTGEIADMWGNRYIGGGTYRVTIAEPFDLTPGVVPGTPFEVGNHFNPGLIVAPGVSADVDVRLRVFPLDGGETREYRLDGRTNRFGTYQPPGESYAFDVPGEYLVDYEARFRDRQGRLWAASLRGAGVIASPDAGVIAHGERGLPGQPADLRPAWFELPQYSDVLGVEAPARLNTPYFSGDFAQIGDERTAGMNLTLRLQDRVGAYQAALLDAFPNWVSNQAMPLAQLAAEDELPIIGLESPDSAYAYLSAVRPGVSVRQFVLGGNDGGLPLYWDSDDPHNNQIGAGAGGERPGDYLFVFGGAILRGETVRTAAIYGALASVIADEGDSATLPPGRGRLLSLPNDTYDMFVYPTALRPGAILVRGETVSIGGQVAPTLPARVSVRITAPSGLVYEFITTANQVGYFYMAETAFQVNEIGVWTAEFNASYAGATSNGIIDPISGGVVGGEGGRFWFYVVPPNVSLLPWNPNLQDAPIPVAIQYNFNFVLPDDWTAIRVYQTHTMPGHILENRELRAVGRSFTYTLNPPQLTAAFPNLENDPRARGISASDSRVLTFVATGINGDGQPVMLVRQFAILHDRLISFE